MNINRSSYTRIAIMILTIVAMLTCFFAFSAESAYASSVVIGQATNGEGGKLRGCKAGDQSGGEVSTSSWSYGKSSGSPYHWKYVFRAKDPEIAKKIAANMKAACANNHIGYDKNNPDRCSLYDQAKRVGWDISKISTNCETTCASVVSVCLNAAGVNVPRMWYSGIVYKDIMKTGQFECLTSSDYTASSAKLLPGDILCNPDRHTAMVVESPNKFTFDVEYKNTYGKSKTVEVYEDESIGLNLNNGSNVKDVTVDKHINLKDYTPEKSGYDFNGWIKVDNKSYSAQYKSNSASIATSGKIVSLD